MTATFAPITDRPRLFDDRPRGRRPASRDAEVAERERAARDAASAAPELTPRGPELAPRGDRPTGADAAGPAPTLDHVISGVWDDLTAHRTVSCPVCHGQMAPRYGSGAHPVGGRCRRCGSSLG